MEELLVAKEFGLKSFSVSFKKKKGQTDGWMVGTRRSYDSCPQIFRWTKGVYIRREKDSSTLGRKQ